MPEPIESSVGDLPTLPSDTPWSAATRPPHSAPPGFTLERELGRGGMGVVHLATQHGLNRPVALKMMLGTADAKAIIRFLAESESIAAIHHPNVVEVYHFGEHQGQPFLALEYCSGGSLNERRPGNFRAIAELMANVAAGVEAAHAQGIVHRDLKPHNVLLTEQGEPKVTDFGLAKRASGADLTKTAAVMGTPAYMPPEQARGDTKFVGPPADVWALGVMLYELLTGQRPFRGDDSWSILAAIQRGEFAAPRSINPAIPRELELITLKCLSTEPHERYSSAGPLETDLRHWLNGESLSFANSHAVNRVLLAMDRVRLQENFRSYSSLFLALIPVMFLPELWTTVIFLTDESRLQLTLAQFSRIAGFLLVVGWSRNWNFRPEGPVERQIWVVWGGFLVASLVSGLGIRIAYEHSAENVRRFYIGVCSFTGAAFLSLATTFWGYCALFGGLFFATTFVMALDLRWAPLEYGIVWSIVLALIGLKLRRMS